MTTIGNYTEGTARRRGPGPVELDAAGNPISATEFYDCLHPAGTSAHRGNTGGLPEGEAAHPLHSHLRVSRFQFNALDPWGKHWEIAVEYRRGEARAGDEETGFTRVVARDWGTSESAADLVADMETGEPVLNSAGDPFDAVPQVDRFAPMVHLTRLESGNPAAATALSGTVNDAEVTVLGVTFPAYGGRIRITARDLLTTDALRYEVDYTIEGRSTIITDGVAVADIGYDVAFLQQGYYYLDNGDRKRFMEPEEETEELRPSAQPMLLDGDGGDNRDGVPVIKVVAAAKAASWTSLNLPSTV